jgi:hypothetical protein
MHSSVAPRRVLVGLHQNRGLKPTATISAPRRGALMWDRAATLALVAQVSNRSRRRKAADWSLALTRLSGIKGIFFLRCSSEMTRHPLMGYPTKLQCIQRRDSQQFYINFPTPLAQALDLQKGEQLEWTIVDKGHLLLSRQVVPPDPVPIKKNSPP